MSDWSGLTTGLSLFGTGALMFLLAVFCRPLWRRLRRVVALVDVLTGRPERYHGDPEARPSLVEQLDDIRRHLGNGRDPPLRKLVQQQGQQLTEHGTRIRRVEHQLGCDQEGK